MKKCFKCGELKALNNFYKHSRMFDGRLNKCKECNKKDVSNNRKKNIDYYREYDRKRGSRQTKEYRYNYRMMNKVKYVAQYLATNAIRDGRLVRGTECEECKSTANLHGHHDDYTKPLDVRYLCPPCHFAWHKKHGEGKT